MADWLNLIGALFSTIVMDIWVLFVASRAPPPGLRSVSTKVTLAVGIVLGRMAIVMFCVATKSSKMMDPRVGYRSLRPRFGPWVTWRRMIWLINYTFEMNGLIN